MNLGPRAKYSVPATYKNVDYAKGWTADTYMGLQRLSAFGTAAGKRTAFVRFPERKAVIIVLTNDDSADAKGMAEKIAERLLPSGG